MKPLLTLALAGSLIAGCSKIKPPESAEDRQVDRIVRKIDWIKDCLRQTPELWKENHCEERRKILEQEYKDAEKVNQ